ncbi:MAG TPA: hypothetical protein VLA74_10145 [Nitrososphaeraceae archaeon]|nr:hypothetical protein [Nitrososphaeraceae archaeon]
MGQVRYKRKEERQPSLYKKLSFRFVVNNSGHDSVYHEFIVTWLGIQISGQKKCRSQYFVKSHVTKYRIRRVYTHWGTRCYEE